MFVFHRDEFHAHALLGATSLDSGTSAYLTCRRINKYLNEGSSRRRIRCTDEQSAQAKVVHYRNRSFVAYAKRRSSLSGRQSEHKHDVRYLGLTLASLQPFDDGDRITSIRATPNRVTLSIPGRITSVPDPSVRLPVVNG